MTIEEGYIQYNEEEDIIMYWFRDGCGMSLNASDGFYVWLNSK